MGLFDTGLEYLVNSGFLYIAMFILVYAIVDSLLGTLTSSGGENKPTSLVNEKTKSVIAFFTAIIVVSVGAFFEFVRQLLVWYITLAILFFLAIFIWGIVSGEGGIKKLQEEAKEKTTVQRAILGIIIITFIMLVSRVFANQLFAYSTTNLQGPIDPTQLALLVLRSSKIFGILAIAGVMLVGVYAVSGINWGSNKGNNS